MAKFAHSANLIRTIRLNPLSRQHSKLPFRLMHRILKTEVVSICTVSRLGLIQKVKSFVLRKLSYIEGFEWRKAARPERINKSVLCSAGPQMMSGQLNTK